MKISVKIPSRGRPNELIETINKWNQYAKDTSNIEFIVTLDSDDSTFTPDVAQQLARIGNLRVIVGANKTKQEAVNASLDQCKGDIIFHICDDVVCKMKGWDEKIIADMQEHFPHFNGVLHYPDGIQNERLCTHPVVGKHYLSKFGYISHPAYIGLFADNEFTKVATHLKKIVYIPTQIFEHDHPMKGNRAFDALNERDQRNFAKDQAIFINRMRTGFDGIIPVPPKPKVPNVVVCVLSNGDWRGLTGASLCGMIAFSAYNCRDKFIIPGFIEEQCSTISPGRNHAVMEARAALVPTHILFVDADATVPVDALQRLIAHDVDVVGCQAVRRKPPHTPTGVQRPDGKWTLGCHVMLIKIDIFDKIAWPWFNGRYLENGDYLGEDQHFCNLVNEISEVHCDLELSQEVGHVGHVDFKLGMFQTKEVPK